MTRDQIVRVAILSAAILVVVIALDYLMNVVIAPGVTPYTPVATIVITLLVAPPFTAFILIQNAKVDQAQRALADERVARLAADGANLAKTQFIANMSHELRTPLNAIIGYAEMVEEDARTGGIASCAEDSQRIQRSAHHLLGLISEILDHARLETGKFELRNAPTELAPLFAEIAETARIAAAVNGNTLKTEFAPDLGIALIDPLRLRQCVLHLTNNAAKFTKNGLITLRVSGECDVFSVQVADTGVGMSEEIASHVFEPFAQADSSMTREHGGIGLGLAITKQILDAMGGEIAVRSTLGAGSVFTITMKRSTAGDNVVTLAA